MFMVLWNTYKLVPHESKADRRNEKLSYSSKSVYELKEQHG